MPAILVGFCKKKKLKKIGQQRGEVKDARIWSQKAGNFCWILFEKKGENWATTWRGERCAYLEPKGQQFSLGFVKKKAEENWATARRGERCAYLETKASNFRWISFKKKAEENWTTTWRGERCAYLEPKASNFGWVLLKKKS